MPWVKFILSPQRLFLHFDCTLIAYIKMCDGIVIAICQQVALKLSSKKAASKSALHTTFNSNLYNFTEIYYASSH